MTELRRFFVSVAGNIPVNFEATVEAKNKQEALENFLELDQSAIELSEPLWGSEVMNEVEKSSDAGVYIAEQKD